MFKTVIQSHFDYFQEKKKIYFFSPTVFERNHSINNIPSRKIKKVFNSDQNMEKKK